MKRASAITEDAQPEPSAARYGESGDRGSDAGGGRADGGEAAGGGGGVVVTLMRGLPVLISRLNQLSPAEYITIIQVGDNSGRVFIELSRCMSLSQY